MNLGTLLNWTRSGKLVLRCAYITFRICPPFRDIANWLAGDPQATLRSQCRVHGRVQVIDQKRQLESRIHVLPKEPPSLADTMAADCEQIKPQSHLLGLFVSDTAAMHCPDCLVSVERGQVQDT